MMDPGMSAAPLPPMGDPAMAGPAPMDPAAMGGAPRPIDLVLAALNAYGQEKSTETDALLAAVMAATQGGMPSGLGGVSEGPAFGAPAGPSPVDPGMGGY